MNMELNIKVCPQCGSRDIDYLYQEWRKVNGDSYSSYYEGEEEYWCPMCENHPTNLIALEDYKTTEK